MATLGATVKTLADWGKEIGPDGKTAKIIEILSQTNEVLEDAMWKEGNLPTGEQTSICTGLPATYWRMINQPIATSKSTTAQVTETCGMLESYSETDIALARLNGNVGQFRLNTSRPFMESMSQELASTMFYGAASAPEEFVGFANRYAATTDANGENILLAGGSGADNASVYLIGWGENTIHGIFPKGSKAGLEHADLGEQVVTGTAGVGGTRMRAYVDHFKWDAGLVVKDWRYGVRIANIDISDLAGLSGTQELTDSTLIIKLMSRAIDRMPTTTGINLAFYANRTVKSLLRVAALEKSSSALSIEAGLNQFGQNIQMVKFLGIPVRTCDALTNAESLVA